MTNLIGKTEQQMNIYYDEKGQLLTPKVQNIDALVHLNTDIGDKLSDYVSVFIGIPENDSTLITNPDYSCTKFLTTAKSVKYDKSP